MKTGRTSRIITWLAGIIFGGGAFVVPLGFFLISYQHETGSLETEARIKARIITQIVSSNPLMWEFEQVRLRGILTEDSKGHPAETQHVFNSKNELIAENIKVIRSPVIIRSAEIFDSGVVVGRIEVRRSFYPILKWTGLIGLVVLPLAAGTFLLLLLVPIRTLRRAEETVRRSEEKYRKLMELANDAIFVADADTGIIIDVNKKAGVMLGLPPEKIIGMHQSRLHPPEEAERYRNIFRESVLKGDVIIGDLFVVNASGRKIPVDISANITEIRGKRVIQGIFRDITERKKTEEDLRESEARYALAADVAHLGYWERDMSSQTVFWSRETYRIFGVDPQNFEPTIDNFISRVHPDDRESLQHSLDYMLANKDKYNTRYRIVRPNGEIRSIHSRGQVKLDEKGETIRIIGTVQDITERTHIEETLQWAEQLNVVAQLTKGLAEDIKNSLAGIRASIEVLAKEHQFSAEDSAIKSDAINEIDRIKQTLNSFLSFTRPPKSELMSVNMNDILDMTISFSMTHPYVSYSPPSKITFARDFDKKVPDVMADPYQLQQIFLNLIFNSFDAMPDGGTITVATHYIDDLNYIQITISDTGRGIDEKVKDKIFQPFCSTKPKGTGLGLAITRRILDQHGGEICVGSNPGGGAVFYISYPVNSDMD
jgi:PAS domain S-box-containing protein